jgi:nucleotide-binding universal stress UspA family protein
LTSTPNRSDVAAPPERPSSKVVVGVDGSEHSILALRWAANEAAMLNVPLEVITAWTFPDEPAPLGIEIHVPIQEELMAQARAKLNQIIDEVIPDTQCARVIAKVIRGRPDHVLLGETNKDDLLVVGSRGGSPFEELVFGSVSDRCVRHAFCTVVVVR